MNVSGHDHWSVSQNTWPPSSVKPAAHYEAIRLPGGELHAVHADHQPSLFLSRSRPLSRLLQVKSYEHWVRSVIYKLYVQWLFPSLCSGFIGSVLSCYSRSECAFVELLTKVFNLFSVFCRRLLVHVFKSHVHLDLKGFFVADTLKLPHTVSELLFSDVFWALPKLLGDGQLTTALFCRTKNLKS